MFWLILTVWFVQQDASELPAAQVALAENPSANQSELSGDAWEQEARDWLVACRVAYDKLSPEQTKALTDSFQKLSPAALRVLMTVYEQTYHVVSPLSAADRRPPDATEAEREWIMAYRILYDHLSVDDAKAYAKTLEEMSPSQIRALLQIYQEKNDQRASDTAEAGGTSSRPGSQPDSQEAARRSFEEAQQRMQFEQERRRMALGRASNTRKETAQAAKSANASAKVTAAAENQRLRDIDQFSKIQTLQHNAFQNRMYERSTTHGSYGRRGYGGYRGYGSVPFY